MSKKGKTSKKIEVRTVVLPIDEGLLEEAEKEHERVARIRENYGNHLNRSQKGSGRGRRVRLLG